MVENGKNSQAHELVNIILWKLPFYQKEFRDLVQTLKMVMIFFTLIVIKIQ